MRRVHYGEIGMAPIIVSQVSVEKTFFSCIKNSTTREKNGYPTFNRTKGETELEWLGIGILCGTIFVIIDFDRGGHVEVVSKNVRMKLNS